MFQYPSKKKLIFTKGTDSIIQRKAYPAAYFITLGMIMCNLGRQC